VTEAIAIAHPNIALVKYWGKRDTALNLPAVPSLSMTLARWHTRTRVLWGVEVDRCTFNGAPADAETAAKVFKLLSILDADRPPVEVETANTFPSGAGLASSSSGFAALALAATAAAGRPLTPAALSVLARRGSGSACRSLYGGFVAWRMGERADGLDSHAEPIAPADHWDVRMVVATVSAARKPTGSTVGMERTRATSPYWDAWVSGSPALVTQAEAAIRDRDLPTLGAIVEASSFRMHATMHTTEPPILYWLPGSVAALQVVRELRAAGVGAWATMDAGPNVKVLCAAADAERVAAALRPVVAEVTILEPGPAASLASPVAR
jgi:diphosphomevalonate decarboxylase